MYQNANNITLNVTVTSIVVVYYKITSNTCSSLLMENVTSDWFMNVVDVSWIKNCYKPGTWYGKIFSWKELKVEGDLFLRFMQLCNVSVSLKFKENFPSSSIEYKCKVSQSVWWSIRTWPWNKIKPVSNLTKTCGTFTKVLFFGRKII